MDNRIFYIVLLLVASAFFSATETAYSSMSKLKLKNMASSGNKKAEKVLQLSEKYTKLISTILVGNNIVNIVAATLFTLLFVDLLGNGNGPLVSSIVSTLLVLVFSEVTPKTLAKEAPESFAMFVYPVINLIIIIFAPITYFFELWKKFINLFLKPMQNDSVSSEEILTLVEEAQGDGSLDEHEADLVTNALEFNDLDVRDILTPRIDVIAIDVADDFEHIERTFRENHYSRVPIYEDNIDNIIGYLQDKDFYYAYYRNKQTNIRKIMKDVQYTSAHVKISTLLRQLQQTKTHMAIVVDEYGGTEGLITMEDILEELVGEIYDEHDEIEVFVKKIDDNTIIVKADMEIKDLFDYLGVDDEEEYDFVTTAGWVIHNLDKMPSKNDSFCYKNFKITVIECNNKIVTKVKIERFEDIEIKK